MLQNLLIEFSKIRACRSQDNALVEGKNGAIIRKHMGYGHVAAERAEAVHKFYTAHLNPYFVRRQLFLRIRVLSVAEQIRNRNTRRSCFKAASRLSEHRADCMNWPRVRNAT